MKTLTRATIMKTRGRLEVDEVSSSADRNSPKVRRNGSSKKESTCRFQEMTVLAFSDPILRMSPRTGELKQGALRGQEGAKSMGGELAAGIRPKGLDGGRELSANHGDNGLIVR